MPELWKPVDGYEGLYEVSSLGCVRSLPRMSATWTGSEWRRPGRELTASADTNGYMRVLLTAADGSKKAVKVHRLVAKAFCGEANGTVNHIDGDKANNTASNLEWCSQADNNRHAIKTGLVKSKIGQKQTKLSYTDATDIRVLASFGLDKSHIARLYGASRRAIGAICSGTVFKVYADSKGAT